MRSLRSRTFLALGTVVLAATVASASGVVATGCAADSDSEEVAGDAIGPYETSGDTKVQVVDVGDDAKPVVDLCGDERFCDPDVAAICAPLPTDAGSADASEDGGDGGGDGSTVGSTLACRVVKRDNRTVAACAPAGTVVESQFCASDDECAPGLACVGEPGLGRCLRFCCKTWKEPEPSPTGDAGAATHYCSPQPLAARPSDRVPVWVKLDNCTLLDDELQCAKGTTCTVVTNDGRTTCVPAGSGRDDALCDEEPCDRGYVCLGTVERRCRKLCREAEAAGCPAGGYCQRVPTIPAGYGICAGGDAGTK